MKRGAGDDAQDRFAAVLRRLRWPLVIAWLLAVVLLHGLSGSLSQVTDDGASAYLPSSAPSTQVAVLQEGRNAGPQAQVNAADIVFARDSGLTAGDQAAVAAARAAVAWLAGHTTGLGPPGPVQPSADGQAAQFTVNVTGSGSLDHHVVQGIRAEIAGPVRSAGSGLVAAVTGAAAIKADSSAGNAQDALLLTALVIVALIMFIVYRSPLLWLLPLLGAIGAIVLAQACAHGLANAGLTVSTLSADILIVLVFGAASDYALLLIHRYREELCHHAAPEAAMAVSLRATLPTLVASAATVICAMICLLAADSASLHGLGPVGAVGIAAAFLAQATFLPSLLLVIGRPAFWPRVPRDGAAGRDGSRVWSGIGARVARRPVATTLAALVLLGASCAGLATVRIDNDPVDNVKGHAGSVAGAQLLARHYPAGAISPLIVLAPPPVAHTAEAIARATPGVGTVLPGTRVQGYASYSVVLSVPPFGPAGTAAILGLRQRLDRNAPGSLVGGSPAIEYDTAQAAGRDDLVIIPLVLVVIFVVITLLLRAVIAPLVLVTTTALSFAASLGLSSLLWQYGFGYSGVQSVIPIYIFIFLVALGVDYSIFLSARIREESRRMGHGQAIVRGLSVTGGVITAAGVVLAGTFAALTQIPQVDITEVGTAVALGVLLDCLLVRTVLVPASLLTIGDRAWWPNHADHARDARSTAGTPEPVTPPLKQSGRG